MEMASSAMLLDLTNGNLSRQIIAVAPSSHSHQIVLFLYLERISYSGNNKWNLGDRTGLNVVGDVS